MIMNLRDDKCYGIRFTLQNIFIVIQRNRKQNLIIGFKSINKITGKFIKVYLIC